MKIQLTQKNVVTLALGEYRDTELPRFVLRVRKKGRTYGICYEQRGETIRAVVGDAAVLSLADARKQARVLLAGAWSGVDPREAKKRQAAAGLTVGELADKCLEAVGGALSAATLREYKRIRETELKPIEDEPAAMLTSKRITALLDDILPKVGQPRRPDGKLRRSGYMANHTFAFLRRVYAWGVRQEMVTGSPCAGMTKRFEEKENERFLSPEEVRAFCRAIDDLQDLALKRTDQRSRDPRATAAMLLMLSGVRRRAVLGARVEEFEQLEAEEPGLAVWRVPGVRMKSKRNHTVPLSRQAAQLVRRRIAEIDGGSLLFPSTREVKGHEEMWWSSSWVDLLKAGLNAHLGRKAEPWRIHDLRATLSTHMCEALRVSPAVVDKLLDHGSDGPRVRRRYNKATLLDARREALQQWADWIDGLRRADMRATTGTGGSFPPKGA